ncbi:protein DEHYDRATION-INDUCED 19 homolog 6 isoform X2 [Ricinus communis]|uniref:protein DEHYDRATION-INDUCED 19 homolog 6 isoform X2 n=1 Tax=Ricinus communis TaxID=3988 RepID=UPI00201A8A91|nr:protein DEHYDRATION-INDUCED 19 homolog 6 isoform X2 [Ricinus communis]
MEDDTWSFALSTSSRSYQSALRSLSDLCLDFEEVDGDNINEYEDDDIRAEYPCPFCIEDFDLVELCSHIDDDHPFESKPGYSLTRNYRLQKLKLQKDGSYSTLSLLKKELQDGHFQCLLDVPSPAVSSSKMEPDPLMSFLYNAIPADKSGSVQPHCLPDVVLEEKSSEENILERDMHQSPLSEKEQIEKGRRSRFVQGLLLSTIFEDDL